MLLALLLLLAAQDFPSRALHPHAGGTEDARLTPDGKLLVTRGAPDGAVKVWIVETGRELQPLTRNARALAASPDGTTVAAGGAKETTVWDPVTGAQRHLFASGAVHALAYSRDGRALTTLSSTFAGVVFSGFTVAVWDLKSGQALKTFAIPVNKNLYCTAISPDATRLAIPRDDLTLRIWDLGTEKEVAILSGHADRASVLCFSPDGGTLVSGSLDKSVRLWDPATGKERRRMTEAYPSDPKIAFSRDGSLMAVTAEAGIELWDMKAERRIAVFRPPDTGIFNPACLEIAPDGKTLLAGGTFIAKDAPKDKKVTGPIYFWKIKR